MQDSQLDDARASDPVERLLEESWESRTQRANRRELVVEGSAAVLFLAVAGPLAAPALAAHQVDPWLALLLVGLYALVATAVRFPLGAGYVVPTYVILVPMLLLLPPSTVPLLTAAALVLGSVARWAARRVSVDHVLFSIPNAWHAVGPALVLMLAGTPHGVGESIAVYLGAFLAGCIFDLASSTLRESFALAVTPTMQLRVVAVVWLIDGCVAPLGLLLGRAARDDHLLLLMMLPVSALLVLLERDRSARIAQAQHRLELVARERTRLQGAVRRLGDAFAAKLDLPVLSGIVLHGSVEALDGDGGQFTLDVGDRSSLVETAGDEALAPLLQAAARAAQRSGGPRQVQCEGVWALAVPLAATGGGGSGRGALTVARRDREFRIDEQELLVGLVDRAHTAVAEILAHEVLREQALTDALTGLGNRRRLAAELSERLVEVPESREATLVLMLFDLDGFKSYNDTFGHPAGDALLTRLGNKLAAAVAAHGSAYRLGGDEFCAVLPTSLDDLESRVAVAADALREQGETFSISASCGAVLLPHEATTPDYALQLADERMYERKRTRASSAKEQTRDVLIRIMHAKQPGLREHSTGVARLAVSMGRRLGMNTEQLDELGRAAELHDIGKVGIPDAILEKPGVLDAGEWEFIHQHTILGERILSAAPALRPVAKIVRASHERWDGRGYPDGLSGEDIPLAARIVAVCDAYEAITGERCYRPARSDEEARAVLLEEAGHQFDPVVVEAFLEELDRPEPAAVVAHEVEEEPTRRLAQEVTNRFAQILELRR
ncbi:MAG: bifunctional diguanylate cyclase/phosphohydrolase [Solirubrobacteraceae bacterium]